MNTINDNYIKQLKQLSSKKPNLKLILKKFSSNLNYNNNHLNNSNINQYRNKYQYTKRSAHNYSQ